MKIGIAGAGLIGGSLALALRARHDVRVYAPTAATRAAVTKAGLRAVDALDALLPADIAVVATPLAALVPTLAALAARSDGALLLDVGSLKRPVAAFAETAPAGARIVGGHPMAGTTASGFAAAREDLFEARPFFLIPTARSDDAAMAKAGDLALEVKAVPTVCSAEAHDRMVAMLSAVPLVVARALAAAGADVARFAGPGFRDATRLAATPADLADAIVGGNADNVKDALAKFREALAAEERKLP